jgi:hypothetical protein
MDPNSQRPARKVGIADHIWDAFEEMAQAMGSDRDALINQAMFMFARLNGFLDGNAAARVNGAAAAVAAAAAAPRGGPAPKQSPAPVLSPVSNRRDDAPPPRPRLVEEKPSPKLEDDPVRREVAERVLETAAELERLIKGKNDNRDEDEEMPDESDAIEDANGLDAEPQDQDIQDEPQEDSLPSLYLMAEGGEMDKIAKDRFVIGRGKHCDFVINSGKVSREHAVIMRDGGDYYIEDLGSSNGTWFNKQRIKRRKIEDGDEYYICSEKIKLVMR